MGRWRIKEFNKRHFNRVKRRTKKIKKIRPRVRLHNILLIIIILKLYGLSL